MSDRPVTAWLGVLSRDHVRQGVALGIAQIGHGQKAGLARMRAGDALIYYSPRETMGGTASLRAFTAIGRIADDELWPVDAGEFRPWRRRMHYDRGSVDVPISGLQADLELTQAPNWGYPLRRGLVELSEHDYGRIARAMGSPSVSLSGS